MGAAKPWLIAIAMAVAAGIGGGAAVWSLQEPDPPPPDLARGASLYAEHCAACHGANLEGEANWRERRPDGRLPAPPHDATGHTWHHPDSVLFRITKEGSEAVIGDGYQSDMIGFGDVLTDQEIRDILGYIKSQWPERERLHQERLNLQDEANR